MKKLLTITVVVVMIALIILPVQASASSYTVTDVYGSSATFNVSGGTLTVTLVDGRAATTGGQELTALFFNLSGVGTLMPGSAIIASGNTVLGGSFPSGGNVGGEWEYLGNLTGLSIGATRGIGSAGLGVFGDANFNGLNLPGGNGKPSPLAVDGPQWGLTNGVLPNGVGHKPLVSNSVVFTLSGAGSFAPSTGTIADVTFWYGTGDVPNQVQVPEPTTLLLLGFGLIAVSGIRRKLTK